MKKRNRFLTFLSRTKLLTRLLSLFLSLVLIFFVVPSVVYGEVAEAISSIGADQEQETTQNNDADGSLTANNYEYETAEYEVVELREESAKHFHLSDGSYVASQYAYPVHYEDENGKLVDIDNSLTSAGSEYSNSNSRIKFVKKTNGSSTLFTLHDGNTKLEMSLVGANKGVVGVVTNGEDNEGDTELQKMMNLEKLSSTILYADILDGVDLEYVAYSMNVKDNIIVKEKLDSYIFSFDLKLNGMWARREANGDISIFSGKGSDTDPIKYVIPAPVVYDANGVFAPAECAQFVLTYRNGGKYTLTVLVDEQWMNSEERAYPITVDPELQVNSANAIDTSVSSSTPYTMYGSQTALSVLSDRVIHWKATQLPTISTSSRIVEATLTMYSLNQTSIGAGVVGAYEVLTDWDENLTWNEYIDETNPQGKRGEMVDYRSLHLSGEYTWNITPIVKDWYSGNNYGVILDKVDDRSTTVTLASTEHSNEAYRPSLVIHYENLKGLEDYWSYSSHSAGNNTGAINLATGQLTLLVPTLSISGQLLKYTPTLVYDSSMYNKRFVSQNALVPNSQAFTPYGFRLNISEAVMTRSFLAEDGTTKPYYVYADEDGTEHSFYPVEVPESEPTETIYVDASGLQMTMDVSDDIVLITYADKTKKVFERTSTSSYYRLWRIADKSSNSILITYDSSGMPTKLSFVLSSNYRNMATLELKYNSQNQLVMVYNPISREVVVFGYSSTPTGAISNNETGYLRTVTHYIAKSGFNESQLNALLNAGQTGPFIVKSSYEYQYTSGCLTAIIHHESNTSVAYRWLGKRISYVYEVGNMASGQTIAISYGNNLATVRSSGGDDIINTSDDISTVYTFDTSGRAISVYSRTLDGEILGATVGEYETQENVKNNLEEQAVIGGTSVNKLFDGSFENGGLNWQKSSDVLYENTLIPGIEFYEKNAVLAPSASNTSYIKQRVALSPGEYSFSMRVDSQTCADVSAWFRVLSASDNEILYEDEIALYPNFADLYNSILYSTIFALDEASDVYIAIQVVASEDLTDNAKVKIDNLMLESGIRASRYSMVQFGDFESTVYDTNGTAVSSSNVWQEANGDSITLVEDSTIFGSSLRIDGELGTTKEVKQRIYENNPEDLANKITRTVHPNKYLVSAYGKAVNPVYSGQFMIRIDIAYYQGEGVDDIVNSHYFAFSPNVTGWQFAGGVLDTEVIDEDPDVEYKYRCVRYIDLVCVFTNQNDNSYALFDNISVVKADDDITKYYYYENGLLARTEGMYFNQYYFYNDNKDLVRQANNHGELIDYTYTTKGLISSISTYDFRYYSTKSYPYFYNVGVADGYITKTLKNKTTYNYNGLGLLICEVTESYSEDGTTVTDTTSTEYTYYLISNKPAYYGAVDTVIDSTGVVTKNFYSDRYGMLVATVNITDGTGLCYSYDQYSRLIRVRPATYTVSSESWSSVADAERVTYTYNSNDLLSSISTESTTYTFAYDAFGNTTEIGAGSDSLAQYEYNPYNGKLKKITYGNGFVVEYVYDNLENISEIWYTINGTRTKAYSYEYTADGLLYKYTDHREEEVTTYIYDRNNRMTGVEKHDLSDEKYDLQIEYGYNTDTGRLQNVNYDINSASGMTDTSVRLYNSYYYNDDGTVEKQLIEYDDVDLDIYYTYDNLGRLTDRRYSLSSWGSNTFDNDVYYTYRTVGDNTTAQIATYTSTIDDTSVTYTYTYDSKGNITKIAYSTGEEIRYYYDDLSQLIREDNSLLNATFVYTYDNAGNILSKVKYALTAQGVTPSNPTKTDAYTYNTSSDYWGDKLTAYKGNVITYDAIGNPLSYYNGDTFTWEGRSLVGAQSGLTSYSFAYNGDGLRISKTESGLNSYTTYYLYDGTTLIAEYSDSYTIVFIYDAAGSPIGMRYRSASFASEVWETYWYEKNLQGDIVAVYSNDGVKLISYIYDAWGNFEMEYEDAAFDYNAERNPLTYRGYYYDSDLGLYYLQSRYYDPVTGRFISADCYIATGQGLTGYNMYAYCGNNPVMRVDPTGESWLLFICAVVIAVISVSVRENIKEVITTEAIVNSNPDIEPMDSDKYANYDDEKESTSGMNNVEKLQYIRYIRQTDLDISQNWTEGEMLRELNYHERAAKILIAFGADPTIQGTWAYRLNHVNFEEKQTPLTYLYRIIGNIIPGR